jgi:hypothetical protein
LNWSVGVWAVSLVGACIFAFSHHARRAKLASSIGHVTVCCAVLTVLFYFVLPKTEARLVKVSFGTTLGARSGFGMEVSDEITNHLPVAAVRVTAENILKITPTNTPFGINGQMALIGQTGITITSVVRFVRKILPAITQFAK